MEQPIIPPIAKDIIKGELTPDKQLRLTNKSNNEIYIITAHNSPNVMREIGRLREIAFREAGGGTGKEVDIDEFYSDSRSDAPLARMAKRAYLVKGETLLPW